AGLGLGPGVVGLDEVHDRDAVRTERGADGRRRAGLTGLDLDLDDRSNLLLCHLNSLASLAGAGRAPTSRCLGLSRWGRQGADLTLSRLVSLGPAGRRPHAVSDCLAGAGRAPTSRCLGLSRWGRQGADLTQSRVCVVASSELGDLAEVHLDQG